MQVQSADSVTVTVTVTKFPSERHRARLPGTLPRRFRRTALAGDAIHQILYYGRTYVQCPSYKTAARCAHAACRAPPPRPVVSLVSQSIRPRMYVYVCMYVGARSGRLSERRRCVDAGRSVRRSRPRSAVRRHLRRPVAIIAVSRSRPLLRRRRGLVRSRLLVVAFTRP